MNGRTKAHIFDRGLITGDRYCDVILSHMRLFRGVISPEFVFADASAWSCDSCIVQELLECDNVCRRDWRACSLNLCAIEREML
ncbi:hypothetical protein TNCV_1051791 [Trichonephila clavipes]|nr:hypothetical protein TNCV_1051791 [Trichonephila clavipes]